MGSKYFLMCLRKITKVIVNIVLTLFLLTIISGCKKEKPMVTLSVNGKEIPYYLYMEKSISEQIPWKKYIQNTEELLYLELESEIKIHFSRANVQQLMIQDSILTEEGTLKYQSNMTQRIDYKFKDKNTYTFSITSHPAVGFSSNLEDYKTGESLIGFDISYEWEGKYYHCLFVIKTEACINN